MLWFREVIQDQRAIRSSVAVCEKPHEDRRRVGIPAAFNRRDQFAHGRVIARAQRVQEIRSDGTDGGDRRRRERGRVRFAARDRPLSTACLPKEHVGDVGVVKRSSKCSLSLG